MATVVVGVDGSPGSAAALRLALEEARLRGARLRAVLVWTMPLALEAPEPFLLEVPSPPGDEGPDAALAALARRARGVLDDAIAVALEGGEPGVESEPVVVEGNPAKELLEASRDADLLVVGARGHGGFHGLRLGSVSEQVAHHSRCPVLLVPHPDDEVRRGS
jgi:nucleotide-binding universal stress UspA family protein